MTSYSLAGEGAPEATVFATEAPAPAVDLLSEVLAAASATDADGASTAPRFDLPGLHARLLQALGPGAAPDTLLRALDVLIARIERLVGTQLDRILHHPRLQTLEASWRGVKYLWDQVQRARQDAEVFDEDFHFSLQLLHVTKAELRADLEKAIDFDQSQMFRKVYTERFDQAGGEPFGLLVGDYQFSNHPADIGMLARISQVSAAAFSPFIAAVAPQFFQLDDFKQLERGLNLEKDLQRPDYLKWRSLREQVDTRFVGLTLPRVLMRPPHELDSFRADGFRFHEDVSGKDHRNWLWGNAAYAFGGVIVRAYATSGWFADIRGFERGQDAGGLVTGIAAHGFATDSPGVALKNSTEVVIDSTLEVELSEQGFIPLCALPGAELAVFYTNPSLYRPKHYNQASATANEKLSSMLQYVMCSARFAHWLKRIARLKIGSTQSAEEMETFLNDWVRNYVTVDHRADQETRRQFPLRDARVKVAPVRGAPGSYRIVMDLLPHYQLDEMAASLRLETRLTASAGA